MNSSRKPSVLFVLGGPGSGKGTQCSSLVDTFKFKHLSAGDLLREEVGRGSPIGAEINDFIARGAIVPGEVTVRLLKQAMMDRGWNKHVFIIDGFPRSFPNLQIWLDTMKDQIDVVGVLLLSCSEETMKNRIMKRGETSGRLDDNEETFKKRIRVYLDETKPVIDHFRQQSKVFEVNAEGTVEDGFKEACQIVETLRLDRVERVNDLREYMSDSADIYIKPLLHYLMENKPAKVHSAIKHWIETEGEAIRKGIEKE
jgi:UMP-CMP kinase